MVNKLGAWTASPKKIIRPLANTASLPNLLPGANEIDESDSPGLGETSTVTISNYECFRKSSRFTSSEIILENNYSRNKDCENSDAVPSKHTKDHKFSNRTYTFPLESISHSIQCTRDPTPKNRKDSRRNDSKE